MTLVQVRPIRKPKWHGKDGKNFLSRPTVITAAVSLRTGQYATGLSEEDRKRLEKITGFNLSPDYNQDVLHPFWSSSTAKVTLQDTTNIFDTSKPIDEIKVKMLKASDLVANSITEYEEGLYPEAIFVIQDESEEIEIKAAKNAIKRKVAVETSKMTKARKEEVIQILSNICVKNQSEDYVDVKLEEAIEQAGYEKTLNLITRDKNRTSLNAMILEALYKQVLRKEGSTILYLDEPLGFDIESTIDYFLDKNHQMLKAQILEKIS